MTFLQWWISRPVHLPGARIEGQSLQLCLTRLRESRRSRLAAPPLQHSAALSLRASGLGTAGYRAEYGAYAVLLGSAPWIGKPFARLVGHVQDRDAA